MAEAGEKTMGKSEEKGRELVWRMEAQGMKPCWGVSLAGVGLNLPTLTRARLVLAPEFTTPTLRSRQNFRWSK